jgi:AcrR family transcriptional regulator
VSGPVKKRGYDSSRRRAAAEETRVAILVAARELFTTRGYGATSVAEIAAAAGVSVDTLYAAVGRKPQLLLAVHDMALAEGDTPLAAEQRRYVEDVRAAGTAEEMIAVYAAALARVLPRSVPLLEALWVAGLSDPDCRKVYESVSDRRAANMRLFATDLRATGRLRDDLDDDAVADLVWSMNSPDYFQLLRSRGYSAERYAAFVRDVWTRTLLR